MLSTTPSIHVHTQEMPWVKCQFHDTDRTSIKKPDELGISPMDYAPLLNIDENILDRIQGSMFGLALGDALGAHVEFRPQSYLADKPVTDLVGGGTWGLAQGQFTDDTSMALCLAISLITRQDFVPYDQLVRYKWWYLHGYMSSTGQCFDIGTATREAIQEFEKRQKRFALENGIPLDQIDFLTDFNLLEKFDVKCSREDVAGNGALMRLAPVPLFSFRHPIRAVEYSGLSGIITHGDQKAYDACRYYGALIIAAFYGASKSELTSAHFYEEHIEWFGNRSLHPEIIAIARGSYKKPGGYQDGIRGKGYIVNALEAALWAFWSDEDSFERGVLNAVNLGDDTDTTAAIYGQLAGAYYGYKKIPSKWLNCIYAKEFIYCIGTWIAYEGDKWFHKIPSAIVRKAVIPTGRIGYLYNACWDCVIEDHCINVKVKQDSPIPSIRCLMTSGDQILNGNLLQHIGFSADFRLSVISNIVQPINIASVITYPFEFDECTRIIHYSCSIRYEGLVDYKEITKQLLNPHATHIITSVDWGLEVVIIMRLPLDDRKIIDDSLNRLCECLKDDAPLVTNEDVLNKIISTEVYSNLPQLVTLKTIQTVCQEIHRIKSIPEEYRPCNYILHSINAKFISMAPQITQNIERRWLLLSSLKKIWIKFEMNAKAEVWQGDLMEQYNATQERVYIFMGKYEEEKELGQNLILRIRQGYEHPEALERHYRVEKEKEIMLKQCIQEFQHELETLCQKQAVIDDLKSRGFLYDKADRYRINQDDDDDTIQHKLIGDRRQLLILCSNDNLNQKHPLQLQEKQLQMIDERTKQHDLCLVYMDFTYSSHMLNTIKVFSSTDCNLTYDTDDSLLSVTIQSDVPSVLANTDKLINIIVVGKSGVGKSTLIKTIANCLKFKTFEDAQPSTHMLSWLTSYIPWPTDAAVPELIRLDPEETDEDNGNPDNSVTQSCKRYIFNIKNGSKLCVIDTPGFSGMHNQCEDEMTMHHIQSYISNLRYLNAICVLIDIDDSEPTGYQQCLELLISFLGEEVNNNLFFCSTKYLSVLNHNNERNARIQAQMKLFSSPKINWKPERVLLFDSTFFLYLIGADGFGTYTPKCDESWSISKTSTELLLYSIYGPDRPYFIHQWAQQAEKAKLEILQMIRPMMETIRNVLRNHLLYKLGFKHESIELHPKCIQEPATICYSCPRSIQRCGNFWVFQDSLHKYGDHCAQCPCDPKKHTQVDYELVFESVQKEEHLLDEPCIVYIIFSGIIHFAHFLMNILEYSNEDLFLISLNRMIDEEAYICSNQLNHKCNLELQKELLNIKADYEARLKAFRTRRIHNDLIAINNHIERIKMVPRVRKQMNIAMKK